MNEKLTIIGLLFLGNNEELAESIMSWINKQERIKKELKLDILIRNLLTRLNYENFDISRSD